MVSKVFIDANILVHYIILNKMKELDKDSKEYKSIKSSYELMSLLLKGSIKDFKFHTSGLAVSEIFYALYDEYRCRMMRREGAPLSSWMRIKHRFKLEEEDLKELVDEITSFLDNALNQLTPLKEEYDFTIIANMVLNYEIKTQDAILLSTAISNNCDIFVTQDKELREKRLHQINVISPETMKNKLKT